MDEQVLVMVLVLGAALMHATWNALIKTGKEPMATMAIFGTIWVTLGAVVASLSALPARPSWGFLLASAILHAVYPIALVQMYRAGDLAHVYPIARGSAPLMLAGVSALVAGEFLDVWEMAGVAAISAGILSLTLERGLPGRREWRPVALALTSGLFTVAYTLSDGLGVRRAEGTYGYTGWLFVLSGLPWVLLLLHIGLRQPVRLPRAVLLPGVLAGAMSMAAYGVVIWALSLAPMATIAALRETSVLFAALIGTLVLGEPFGRRRIVAALLVVAGIALFNLSG